MQVAMHWQRECVFLHLFQLLTINHARTPRVNCSELCDSTQVHLTCVPLTL